MRYSRYGVSPVRSLADRANATRSAISITISRLSPCTAPRPDPVRGFSFRTASTGQYIIGTQIYGRLHDRMPAATDPIAHGTDWGDVFQIVEVQEFLVVVRTRALFKINAHPHAMSHTIL